ncbi:unnamed protein product [Cunninghamella echinulata]
MDSLKNIIDLNFETMNFGTERISETMEWDQDLVKEFLNSDIDNLLMNETNIESVPITNCDMQIMESLFTPEMMVWLNDDFTLDDHLKLQIKNNFNKFMEHCISELDNKWKKESLLDNIIIPDALKYIHNKLKKPVTVSQKRKYYIKRRKILEELFLDLGYEEFKKEIMKKVNMRDDWSNREGGGPPKNWWGDVMKWIRLESFIN